MTSQEAFVETLRTHGVRSAFGIVGSAFMPALDLFERAGIRFVDVAHEQGAAHMADGYARAGGELALCIAQNGPGITNFVTAVAAAFWNHTPMLVVTPETGTSTQGLGGFQETRQLPFFAGITCHQESLAHPARMAESVARCIQRAWQHSAPVQLNLPRDMFCHELAVEPTRRLAREAGGLGPRGGRSRQPVEPARERERAERISPRQALRALREGLPADAMVSTDIGNICAMAHSYLVFESPRSFLAPGMFGNCGYAFPAIMGAKLARPGRPAVALVGDGGFGIALNELPTCRRMQIPVTVVVFRNGQWGAEKKNDILWFGERFVGTELGEDFHYAEVARAFGWEALRLERAEELTRALAEACAAQARGIPTLLEVVVNKELGAPFRRDAMRDQACLLPRYRELSLAPSSSP